MEAVMRHGDIEWVVECFISDREPPDCLQQLPEDLQVQLANIIKYLVTFLLAFHLIEVLSIS
jgi:hypothetical protein